VVPEAQDGKALDFEPVGAPSIVLSLVSVLATVDLDDQLALQADEVDDEWTQRLLATELVAQHLAPAQPGPQGPLGVGHVLAQLPGAFSVHFFARQ
jgi:hypothetical protein